jgi:hypothetical protein
VGFHNRSCRTQAGLVCCAALHRGKRSSGRITSNYRVVGWVDVSYGGVRGLVVIIRVCICLAIVPRGIWGRTRVWHRKARCSVHVPMSEYAGHSLLRHPKSRSQILDGGSSVKVVHQLGWWVCHCSVVRLCATYLWIGLSETNSTRRRRRRRVNIRISEFLSVSFFYQSMH